MSRPVVDLADLYALAQGERGGDSESGGFMSQQQFAALPEEEQMRLAGRSVYRDTDDSLVGYGTPSHIGATEGWYNPQAMTRGENGRFRIGAEGINWDAMTDLQNASDRSGYFSASSPWGNIARGVGTVLGAASLATAAGLTGMGEAAGAGLGGSAGEAAAAGGMGTQTAAGGSALGDVGNWISRTASNIGDYLGGAGAEQLSGPGMEGVTGAVGTGAGPGGDMSWISEILGGGGGGSAGGGSLSIRDIYGVARDIIGGALDQRNQNATRDNSNRQAEEGRQLTREQRFVDQNNPFGTVRNVRDPVTGMWTTTTELNPDDQARLDQYRGIAGGRMANAAAMRLPTNVDFQANVNRYLPPSLGGSYVGTDPWGRG